VGVQKDTAVMAVFLYSVREDHAASAGSERFLALLSRMRVFAIIIHAKRAQDATKTGNMPCFYSSGTSTLPVRPVRSTQGEAL